MTSLPPGYPSQRLTMATAPTPPGRFDWRRNLLLIGLVAAIAVCGIVMLILVGFNIGPTALAVGIVAAIIPVPALVACFLWLDRYEPEPVVYLAFCLAWGACVATLVAYLLNNGASMLFHHNHWPQALVACVTAPVVEESMKAAGPLLLFWRRPRSVSGVVDGIVYCGLSATGFAMVENILYLGGYGYAAGADEGGAAAGVAGVIQVFIGRIVLSGLCHPLFTAMTGIGLGLAARASSRKVRRLAPVAGLLLAMTLHGSWNLMSTLAQSTGQELFLLYGYFAVMMPIFLGVVSLALWLRSWEGRLTQRVLPEYVRAGWLTPPEVAALATMGRRMAARAWAKRVAGDSGAAAMRGYQFAATQLSLLRDGLHRGLTRRPEELAQAMAEERRLLETIAWYRAGFAHDPQAPPAIWDGAHYHVTFPDGSSRPVNPAELPVAPIPVLLPRYFR